MKKIFYVFLMTAMIAACNNSGEKKTDEQSAVSDSLAVESDENKRISGVRMPVYRGEVIFTEEAAVIKGKDFIYGIEMDTLARELAARVEPIKKDEFDMVKPANGESSRYTGRY